MKIKNKNKQKQKSSSEESSKGLVANWMVTGRENIDREVKNYKTLQEKRVPEFFLKNGDNKRIRIRWAVPVLIHMYQFRVDGKWRTFTRPGLGERDLFSDVLKEKARLQHIYEVIDIDGYVDNKGQKHKNVSRFWRVSNRVKEQLDAIEKLRGPLNTYDIDVSRTGEGTATNYALFAHPKSPKTAEMKKAPVLRDKILEFYAPLSLSEQTAIVSARRGSSDDEENPY